MSRLDEIRHRTDKPHLALQPISALTGLGFRLSPTNSPRTLGELISIAEFNYGTLALPAYSTLGQVVGAWYYGRSHQNLVINRSLTTC